MLLLMIPGEVYVVIFGLVVPSAKRRRYGVKHVVKVNKNNDQTLADSHLIFLQSNVRDEAK
jgi:hypothetical protein